MGRILSHVQLLSGQSALNAVGPVVSEGGLHADAFKVYVRFSAGTSAGGVTIEEASSPTYAGVWHTHATIPWSIANGETISLNYGCFLNLRARVTTAVVGGTVDVWMVTTGN